MPIEFHCPKCGKHIKAPDQTGGKRGKCPSCQQSVYIPTPAEDLELLDLTPLDEEAEREQQRLLEETRRLADAARHEDFVPEIGAAPSVGGMGDEGGETRSDVQALIEEYAREMAEGRLTEADKLATRIRRQKAMAEEIMQQMTLDELPPARLQHIPRPVLVGFFKQLREGM